MKGYIQDDKNTICLPRQYLQESHGRVRDEGLSPKGRARRPVRDRLCRHQHRGDREPGTPGDQGEAALGGDQHGGEDGPADGAVGSAPL